MSDNQIATSAGHIIGGEWVAAGLNTSGGMAALDATMGPVDALGNAGLGFLTSYVQPLQAVVDRMRMAGKASVIQTVADAWLSTAVEFWFRHAFRDRPPLRLTRRAGPVCAVDRV